MTIIEWIQANPKLGIILISIATTSLMTVVRYFLTDKEVMRRIKAEQKNIREEMKKYKDNPDKMMELNKQMMEHLPVQMKQSMKIALVTMIPFLILINWLKGIFATTILASAWMWWYIGVSIVFSILLAKVFKLD